MMTRLKGFKVNPLLLMAIMFLAISASLVHATTYQDLSLEEMIAKVELAFYGTVIATEPTVKDGEIWTTVSFELLTPYKGYPTGDEAPASTELSFYGGQPLDGAGLQVSLMPTFNVGESVVVFAYEGDFYSPIVGFRQGLWRESDAGFRSETGDFLSIDADNKLVLTGGGASPSDTLNALKAAFEVQP